METIDIDTPPLSPGPWQWQYAYAHRAGITEICLSPTSMLEPSMTPTEWRVCCLQDMAPQDALYVRAVMLECLTSLDLGQHWEILGQFKVCPPMA